MVAALNKAHSLSYSCSFCCVTQTGQNIRWLLSSICFLVGPTEPEVMKPFQSAVDFGELFESLTSEFFVIEGLPYAL